MTKRVNRTDLTLRNLKALHKRFDKLEAAVKKLAAELKRLLDLAGKK